MAKMPKLKMPKYKAPKKVAYKVAKAPAIKKVRKIKKYGL